MVRGDAVVGAKFSGQAALTARLMMYVLIAIVLMAMDHRGKYVPRLRAQADYLIEPIYHVVEWPIRAMRGTFSFFQNTQSLLRQNKDLSKQLLAEQSRLQRFEALQEENRRLRELLDGSGKLEIEYQFAELIDVDLDPFSHRVVIDRGRDRDVQVGEAVIDGAGVMGQVEEVDLHFSKVRLISDPNHALPVQINRTGLRTVAMGVGNTSRLSLPNLPREADVREGDLVVTSGLGNRFPAGYPVAVIEVVDRNEGRMFAEAIARPLAALDRGREVLLLKSPPPQPLEPVEAENDAVLDGAEDAVPGDEPDSEQRVDEQGVDESFVPEQPADEQADNEEVDEVGDEVGGEVGGEVGDEASGDEVGDEAAIGESDNEEQLP